MAKTKYRYNPQTLSYEKEKQTLTGRILSFGYVLLFGAIIAVGLVFAFRSALSSANERKLEREIEQWKMQYEVMNRKLDQVEGVLADLEDRDDNIYRVIFEAEPIPDNLRKGSTGGVAAYKELDGYDNAEAIKATRLRLDRLSKQIYIQSRSFDQVYQMAKEKEKLLAHVPAIQPVANKDLTRMASGYGQRIDPHYRTLAMHWGMDFTAPTGTEIYATGDGVVTRSDRKSRGFGKHVRIDHGYGYMTLYAHMSETNVRVGQNVKRGDVIGYVGSTGKSTGPHLHYEVHKNGHPINPVNFFFSDLTPEEYEKMLQISSNQNQSFD